MDKSVPLKTFDELCEIVAAARQSVSIEFNSEAYITREKICKVLEFVNIDTVVLTRENMLLPKKDRVSNVIICVEGNDCVFINHKFKYVIYYSPDNKVLSLLIHRFLSLYYSSYQLITLFDEKNAEPSTRCKIENWVSCILFTATTSLNKEFKSTDMIDVLSKQYNDNAFVLDLQELCQLVSSPQSMMCKMDTYRPRVSTTISTKHSQNMNKILEILYDIVSWCCSMLKNDDIIRSEKLYRHLVNSNAFDKVKKHIKISKTIVHDTTNKFWNRLNYELTLNANNTELIKKTFENIVHCWTTHYKYLIFALVNLLQSDNGTDIVHQHSFTILTLTEDYDEKLRNITRLTDSMCELIGAVFNE